MAREGDQVGVPREGLPSSGNHEDGIRGLKSEGPERAEGMRGEDGVREVGAGFSFGK